MLLTVGRSYVGTDVTHSTLLDRACIVPTALVIRLPGIENHHSLTNTVPVDLPSISVDKAFKCAMLLFFFHPHGCSS